ncbi:hypothetical protein CUMW_182220 [Citrus unshiu]|uniref:Uncharacterized protein n=1 Tax=Citrus sinensis TaxID=2711 RepID=A0ACB8J2C4_CITSI|nr:hypothetical protein KPL71_019632 [Citrus sinensis]GAY57801.1 hypothetical protein CUMW_182220 [Citrus unshiu]
MNTNILQTLASNAPPSSSIRIPLKPSTTATTNTYRGRPIRLKPISSTSGSSSNDAPQPVPPPITPPDTVEIRFRRGSRRQRQRREGRGREKQPLETQASATPKKWEDMSLSEKAMDLYMGEKGLLFWLNKFAYASIFITIGAWILFRFVGPSLNLYQLDAAPLSPSNMFKGS